MLDPTPYIDPYLERFEREGFVVFEDVFTTCEIERMREAFERLEARARTLRETTMLDGSQFVVDAEPDASDRDVRIQRVVWCGGAEPILAQFGEDPRLLEIASRLLGAREFDQLINQAHFKFPGDGVQFDWHQDSRHRRYGTDLWTDVDGRGSFVELVTAIDASTRSNGPIQFIPGTQRLGHLTCDPGTNALPADSFDSSRAVSVSMRPGSVLAFGPFVIHGSRPNVSDAPRRTFLNGFALPGANHRVYPGEGAGRRVRLRS